MSRNFLKDLIYAKLLNSELNKFERANGTDIHLLTFQRKAYGAP